jgi:oleandomycin transport system ATP-binding protein
VGHVTVGGLDVVRNAHQVLKLIGLTGRYAAVDETLTGSENLLFIGRLLGLARHDANSPGTQRSSVRVSCWRALASRTLPDDLRNVYSGGMRRRLDLAASIVGRPRVLFLDGGPTAMPVLWSLVWAAVLVIIFSPLSMRALRGRA